MRRASDPVRKDRGAAAVELALLLPVLFLIIFGIIDFGRALNAQLTLTAAAQDGARLASLNQPDVMEATRHAATGLSNVLVIITPCPAGSGPLQNAVVEVKYSFSFVTPIGAVTRLFGGSTASQLMLTAQGVMPCET